MANFGMAEQYGINCDDVSDAAWAFREKQLCPFKGGQCSKRSKGGVCSITDGDSVAIVCPHRFAEDGLLYKTVSETMFGTTQGAVAVKEVQFLSSAHGTGTAVGKIDNVVAQIDDGKILEWCALEVQAVYFSGDKMGPEVAEYEATHRLPAPGSRRPDIRSSAPKRLLPQLETKVPTLRTWGKKMFVAVDEAFFDWIPPMQEESHITNAEVCWLVFGLDRSAAPYKLRHVKTFLTTLSESRKGLVAGVSPNLPTFQNALKQKIGNPKSVVWRG